MNIHNLPIDAIPNEAVVLALGRRRSGKTTNIFSIMEKKKDVFDLVLVFCGSAATRLEYAKRVPRRFIYDEIKIDVLETLVKMQDKSVQDKKDVRNVCVVIDDCGFQTALLRKQIFRQLFQNGRHYKIFLILSLQYSLGVLPALRGQIDYVICSQEKSVTYRKKIFEHYSIGFKSFKSFDQVFLACTTNFESFVIGVAASSSPEISKNIFFFRSTFPLPDFKMMAASWKRPRATAEDKKKKEIPVQF